MISEFRVGCARTINLGNYESLRVEASVTVEVAEEDHLSDASWNAVKDAAQQELRRLMEQTYREQHKKAEKY